LQLMFFAHNNRARLITTVNWRNRCFMCVSIFSALESRPHAIYHMRRIKTVFFCLVTLCSDVVRYRRFGRTMLPTFSGWRSSETLASWRITTQRHKPEDRDLWRNCCNGIITMTSGINSSCNFIMKLVTNFCSCFEILTLRNFVRGP
jgi:hypothetical protein